MDKEEYYKRIERINNRFKTDRVRISISLSTKYIEHLEQQCKKQKETIDKVILELVNIDGNLSNGQLSDRICNLIDILKEVSE